MYRHFAGLMQKQVGRSHLGLHLAIKLRHQCDAILAAGLAKPSNFAINGERWLISLVAPASKYFVDVGANIGEWSVEFAQRMPLEPRGLAFEPAPRTASALRRQLADVGCVRVEVVECALSDARGEQVFYAEKGCGKTSSFIITHSERNADAVSVPISILDTELSERNVSFVDFLKIDAEGFDFRVMVGCKHYLEQNRIGVLQFEYNSAWAYAGATLSRPYQFLQEFGYKVFLLRGERLCIMDPDYVGEYFRHTIFVATTKDNPSLRDAANKADRL